MEGANKISVYQVAVKAGSSVVEIDTSKLWPGDYTIYVRDIMRTTVGSPFEYYDISPDTVYARYYDAQDDVLVVKNVKVVPTQKPRYLLNLSMLAEFCIQGRKRRSR